MQTRSRQVVNSTMIMLLVTSLYLMMTRLQSNRVPKHSESTSVRLSDRARLTELTEMTLGTVEILVIFPPLCSEQSYSPFRGLQLSLAHPPLNHPYNRQKIFLRIISESSQTNSVTLKMEEVSYSEMPEHMTSPPVALRPNAGQGLLILEVSRSHTTTYHSR